MKARNQMHSHNETLFKTWTEKSAYLCGYLEADGYIKYDGPAVRIYFQCSHHDLSFLKKLKKVIEHTGKISISNNRAMNKLYKKVRFTVSSREWRQDFERIKLRTGQIPNLPKELLNHYIRGYFDGDGSVYLEQQSLRNKSNFVFASKKLAEEFKEVLTQQNIKTSNIHVKTNSNKCWYFTISYLQTEKLREFMYQGGTLYMNRKFQTFLGNYRIAD